MRGKWSPISELKHATIEAHFMHKYMENHSASWNYQMYLDSLPAMRICLYILKFYLKKYGFSKIHICCFKISNNISYLILLYLIFSFDLLVQNYEITSSLGENFLVETASVLMNWGSINVDEKLCSFVTKASYNSFYHVLFYWLYVLCKCGFMRPKWIWNIIIYM